MRRFQLPTREIDAYSSDGVTMDFLPRVIGGDETTVHIARIEAGGTIGRHPAAFAQFFAVLHGEGLVDVDDGGRLRISPGEGVWWEPGEEHQSWAMTPMTVAIVETNGSFAVNEHFSEL